MDLVILLIGLLTLSSLGYFIYKFNSKEERIDDPQKRQEEINQMREMLTLEFKNLANEIFDEKTKKITEVNKENLSNILDPLKHLRRKLNRQIKMPLNLMLFLSQK